jgi:hypothetical protein
VEFNMFRGLEHFSECRKQCLLVCKHHRTLVSRVSLAIELREALTALDPSSVLLSSDSPTRFDPSASRFGYSGEAASVGHSLWPALCVRVLTCPGLLWRAFSSRAWQVYPFPGRTHKTPIYSWEVRLLAL